MSEKEIELEKVLRLTTISLYTGGHQGAGDAHDYTTGRSQEPA